MFLLHASNLLQVVVFDAVGFHLSSELSTVNLGLDFLHIGVVMVIVFVTLCLAIFRLGKGCGSKTTPPEKQEPTSAQQVPPIVPPENQEPTLVQPKVPTLSAAPISPTKEDPLAILRLRLQRGR